MKNSPKILIAYFSKFDEHACIDSWKNQTSKISCYCPFWYMLFLMKNQMLNNLMRLALWTISFNYNSFNYVFQEAYLFKWSTRRPFAPPSPPPPSPSPPPPWPPPIMKQLEKNRTQTEPATIVSLTMPKWRTLRRRLRVCRSPSMSNWRAQRAKRTVALCFQASASAWSSAVGSDLSTPWADLYATE